MLSAVWLIPTLPLVGVVLLLLFGRRLGEPLAGWLATAMVAGSFVAGVVTFLGLLERPEEERAFVFTAFTWIPAGGLQVDIGFLADPLSLAMVLFVTGVGALIHLYSIGYMHGDERFSTFFLYLNLFAFSMLMLVLGDNLLVTFLGWEGVGACSYLLISFWFTNEANASAGKKAFVTNRIGDFGFLVAIFLTFGALGSIDYAGADGLLANAGALPAVTATAIAALLFVGAIGKSAQLPLYVWLPDAMAGPTPVSALIHAATMVTSGIYLLTRVNPVIAAGYDWLPTTIAWVGAATALFAATVAVAQHDIKKVLAYSTVSQLGFMFLALGTGAYVAAIFHMVTHAFFKALLFLGAGSVIHGMHEEQDMRRMGALRTFMPITAVTFIVGWLAISGVPPFSGFWSKDEILLYAFGTNPALWAVGLVAALLTAYYMSRQVFLVFFGSPRWGEASTLHTGDTATDTAGAEAENLEEAATADAPQHAAADAEVGSHGVEPHESPWTMTLPLVVLAALAAVAGGLNLPFSSDLHFVEDWLHPVLGENEAHVDVTGAQQLGLAVAAAVTALVGIALASLVYLRRRVDPRKLEPEILQRAWRYDEALAALFGGPGRKLAELSAFVFDARGIDGVVNGAATLVRGGGQRLRATQSGFVRNYALGLAGGAVLLLGFFLVRTTL